MSFRFRACLFISIILTGIVGGSYCIFALEKKSIWLPLKDVNGNLWLQCQVDNVNDVTFLFDTGVTNSAVDESFASQIADKKVFEKLNAHGEKERWVSFPDFRLGRLKIADASFRIRDLSSFKHHGQGAPVGIFGESLLKKFTVTIDYRQHRLKLQNPSERLKLDGQTQAIAFHGDEDNSGIFFDSLLDERVKLPCVFDTGSQRNLVPFNLVVPILKKVPSADGQIGGLNGERIKTATEKFKTWQVGTLVIKQPEFQVVLPNANAENDPGCILESKTYAAVGNRIWEDNIVTIDYKHHQLFVGGHN